MKNKEIARLKAREWYANNREESNKKNKQKYHNNKQYREKKIAYQKHYSHTHKDQIREREKLARPKRLLKEQSNHFTPKGIWKNISNHCKNRKIRLNITKEELALWFINQEKKCHYCDISIDLLYAMPPTMGRNKYFSLSIDRLNNNKAYQIDNIALACVVCNKIKGDIFSESEMISLATMFVKPKWINNLNKPL